jgi:hypothetical protein
MMSEADTSNQELLLKSEKQLVLGSKTLGRINNYIFYDSARAAQSLKRRVVAHAELYVAMQNAEKELLKLQQTPKRLEEEEVISQEKYAARKAEMSVKLLEQNRNQERLLREIQEEKNAKDLLRLQQELKKTELELQIAELKNKMARLDGSAHDTQSPADPQLDQVRDDMKRYMEMYRHLGNDRKKWFDQIEEDLANKAISEELADEMKDDIEQMIRDAILKPE